MLLKKSIDWNDLEIKRRKHRMKKEMVVLIIRILFYIDIVVIICVALYGIFFKK